MQTLPILKNIQISDVWFDEDKIYFNLKDGRIIGSPLAWFPRLQNADSNQRQQWRLIGKGTGVHWEEIDEDLSVEGMFFYQG